MDFQILEIVPADGSHGNPLRGFLWPSWEGALKNPQYHDDYKPPYPSTKRSEVLVPLCGVGSFQLEATCSLTEAQFSSSPCHGDCRCDGHGLPPGTKLRMLIASQVVVLGFKLMGRPVFYSRRNRWLRCLNPAEKGAYIIPKYIFLYLAYGRWASTC